MAAEDAEFADSDDTDGAESAPGFGCMSSDYETTVGPFYAYWLSYCTKKSYAWLCPHNVTEIRDRRVLRHVEKDTKRLAQKARKERNDEVRALVLFVRKRDRRVTEYRRLLEDRAEQNRIKQQAKRLEQIQRNRAEVEEAMRLQKEAGIGAFGGDYEKQLRKIEATYGSDSDDVSDEDEDTDAENDEGAASAADDVNEIGTRLEQDVDIDDDEEYVDHLYCVACNKSFKNESSLQNHQSSKRHRDNIEKMRIQMLEEEDAHNAAQSDSSLSEEQTAELDTSIQSTHKQVDTPESDTDKVVKPNKQSKKSKRKVQKVITTPPSSGADSEVEPIGSSKPEAVCTNGNVHNSEDNHTQIQPPKQTKKAKRRAMKAATAADLPPVSKPAAPKHATRKPNDSSDDSDGEDVAADSWSNGTRKMGRKAGAKAARKTAAKKPAIVDIDETVDIDHTCVTCAAVFDSKNKLFAHLKHMNHGVYIEGKGITPARAATTIDAAQPRTKGRKK